MLRQFLVLSVPSGGTTSTFHFGQSWIKTSFLTLKNRGLTFSAFQTFENNLVDNISAFNAELNLLEKLSK